MAFSSQVFLGGLYQEKEEIITREMTQCFGFEAMFYSASCRCGHCQASDFLKLWTLSVLPVLPNRAQVMPLGMMYNPYYKAEISALLNAEIFTLTDSENQMALSGRVLISAS